MMSSISNSEEKGVIGEISEDGLPVVFKFVNERPSDEVRRVFPWLTVISWKYDGAERNGMPTAIVNKKMVALEHALENLETGKICRHSYSRTGNNLKELVYYIQDRTQFIDAFNEALQSHPAYPIEINFYEDPGWDDFTEILKMFNANAN